MQIDGEHLTILNDIRIQVCLLGAQERVPFCLYVPVVWCIVWCKPSKVCCTLQDGHHEIWEQEYVAGIVGAEVERRDIETVCPIFLQEVTWSSHL